MQLLIILGIAILIFGTAKLKNAGKDLGGAVKGFKDAVKDENDAHLNKHLNNNKVLSHEETGVPVDDIKVKDTQA